MKNEELKKRLPLNSTFSILNSDLNSGCPMSRLRRAVHFVPGANEKMLQRSLTLAADTLVLDLEDAVTPENKDSARATVTHWLKEVNFGRQERMIRMNPLDTPWGVTDLEVTMQGRPDSYLVP